MSSTHIMLADSALGETSVCDEQKTKREPTKFKQLV